MNAHTRAYLALGVICIVWGTTYTAIKFAIRDFPPFLLVGIRQTAAGLLLLAWAAAQGKAQIPSRRYLLKQGLTGLFTITGGNGFVTWGMQFVSSGLSAIIGSLTPVVVVLINLLWRGGERLNGRILSGVLLGFAGLGFIFHEGWQDFLNPAYRLGILACFGSCFTWSLGTVMAKRYNAPGTSPLMNAGLQISAGGLGGLLLSALFDPAWTTTPSREGWLALVYLTIFGSALAFTLYMFALQHLSATVSSLYTYINPIVAVLLGWLWLGETMTFPIAVGMSITILGVWLVNSGYAWAALKTKMKLRS
jgi:drug/metabolite transporter (DMT)-like permease